MGGEQVRANGPGLEILEVPTSTSSAGTRSSIDRQTAPMAANVGAFV